MLTSESVSSNLDTVKRGGDPVSTKTRTLDATLDIVNPGRVSRSRRVPSATPEDVDRAVRAAHEAQRAWGRLGYAERGKDPPRVAEAFEAHVDELVADPRRRAGQDDPRGQDRAAQGGRHARALRRPARARCARSSVHNIDPGVDGRVLRRPLGVVAAIVPWNFPTTLLCNKLGPALLCGQHRGRQAGRHARRSRRCGWRRSCPRRACRRACSTSSRAPARWPARRSSRHPLVAQGRVHRLARRRASASRRSPRWAPSG